MATWTAAQRNTLAEAIAGGYTEVRYENSTVKYRSQREMIQLLNTIDADIAGTRRPNRVLATFQKGLAK